MKLYTEEQVKKAIELAQECDSDCGGVYFDYTETGILKELTPIELPSDEEIEEASNNTFSDFFYHGAKWMKEQILNQNK